MDSLTATLAALADPTRRSIVDRLARGPATVGEIADPFRMSQQAVSKHVACLERARLVEKRREGRRQVCTLRGAPIAEMAGWAESHRRLWEQRLDRLDEYLKTLPRKEGDHARRTKR